MRIYLSHARKIDYENILYKPIKASALVETSEFILPHDGSAVNTEELLRSDTCDLVIADVSSPSTGQGIELGYAKILEVPVVCIYSKGSEIAGSLKYVTDKFIEYSDPSDLIQKLEKEFYNNFGKEGNGNQGTVSGKSKNLAQ